MPRGYGAWASYSESSLKQAVYGRYVVRACFKTFALPTRGVSFVMQHESHNITFLYIAVMRLSYSYRCLLLRCCIWLKSNTEISLAATRTGIAGICTDHSGTIVRGPLLDKRAHHYLPG